MTPQQQLYALAAIATVAFAVGSLALSGFFSGDDDEKTATGPAGPPPPKLRQFEVGGEPDLIAAGGGSVWVADAGSRAGSRIDPRTGDARGFTLTGRPLDVVAVRGAAWFTVPEAGGLERASASAGSVGLSPLRTPGVPPFAVAAGEGAVWASSEERIQRISADGSAGAPVELPGFATALAAGEDAVWVATDDRGVLALDPDSLRVPRRTPLDPLNALAIGAGAVWGITEAGDVIRVDPRSGDAARAPERVDGALDVAVGEGYVWVSSADDTVTRLDPDTAEPVGDPIELPAEVGAVAVGDGAAWVASDSGVVTRIGG